MIASPSASRRALAYSSIITNTTPGQARRRIDRDQVGLASKFDLPVEWSGGLRRDVEQIVRERGLHAVLNELESLFESRKDDTAFADWIAPAIELAILAGIDSEASQVGTSARRTSSVFADQGDEVDPFDLPMGEAIEYFAQKLAMSAEQVKLLEATARKRAFWISGLAEDHALEVIHDSITGALAEGQAANEWLGQLEETLGEAGLGEHAGLDAHHLRLIYHDAVYGAYAAGRHIQQLRVVDERPFWVFLNPEAQITSEICRALAGVIKRYDDPFWQTYAPPLHQDCRSSKLSLSADEMVVEGLTITPNEEIQFVPLQESWGGDPLEGFDDLRALRG